MTSPLLSLTDCYLKVNHTRRGMRTLVQGITCTLDVGETLFIVGESGSGKTLILKTILHLLPEKIICQGKVVYYTNDGKEHDIYALTEEELVRYRRSELGYLPQSPQASLSPVHTCGKQLCEQIRMTAKVSAQAAQEIAQEMLQLVGLANPPRVMRLFPHQLSGGMAQRVGLALALANHPRLLLVDEPTAALDVIGRMEFYQLLAQLRQVNPLTIILVTHDLEEMPRFADKIMVLLKGIDCEYGPANTVWHTPAHPYSQMLFESFKAIKKGQFPPSLLAGRLTRQLNSEGCPFADRCPKAQAICITTTPLHKYNGQGRSLRCHFPDT